MTDVAKPAILQARGLGIAFGALRVLNDLDFDVQPGEVLGILGPNGAGKTTLFNLISGDLQRYDGKLRFNGAALDGPPFKRCAAGIGRTYQIPQPYAKMTTFENLLVSATFGGGKTEADSYDLCADILRDCGLEKRANTLAGSLALLDRKRLELARALAIEPKMLLLDEIAGGLTEDEGQELVQLIRRIRDQGVTIVWIEHVLHALMAVADRLMVLDFGEKIAEGVPSEVIEDPDVKRVYMGVDA